MSDDDVMNALRGMHKATSGTASSSDSDVINALHSMHSQMGGGTPSAPTSSPWRYPKMAAEAVNAGIASIPNAAITGMNLLNRHVTSPLLNAASSALGGPEIPYHEVPTWNPSTPEAAPQEGTWEPYAAGALSGAASALAGGTLARAVYGGLGAVQSGARAISPLLSSVGSELGRLGNEVMSSGAIPGMAGVTAENVLPKEASPSTKSLVGFGAGLGASLAAGAVAPRDEFASVANRMAPETRVADPKDAVAVAGRSMQEAIRSWKTGDPVVDPNTGQTVLTNPDSLPVKVEALKVPMMAKAGGATTDYANTINLLQNLSTRGGGSQPLLDAISPMLPQTLLRSFQAMAQGGKGITAISPSGQTTLLGVTSPIEEALTARSEFGKMMGDPRLIPKGVDTTQVKAIYSALSSDIGETMKSAGAAEEWKNYNEQTNKMYKAAESTFSKLVSADNETNETVRPEDAISRVWSSAAGGKKVSSDLEHLREHIPPAADEAAAGFLLNQPQNWPKLPERAKTALVPNPWDRRALDGASSQPVSPVVRGLEALAPGSGAFFGEVGGRAINSLLASPDNPLVNPDYLAVLLGGAPVAARAIHSVLKNPSAIRRPLQGGIAGASAIPLLQEENKK